MKQIDCDHVKYSIPEADKSSERKSSVMNSSYKALHFENPAVDLRLGSGSILHEHLDSVECRYTRLEPADMAMEKHLRNQCNVTWASESNSEALSTRNSIKFEHLTILKCSNFIELL